MFLRTALFCAALAASAPLLAADSDIDTDFGIFGTGHNVVSVDAGGNLTDSVAEVLTAADGTLYLVGTTTLSLSESRIVIVHLDANGQVDLDFGTNGRYIGPSGTYNTQASSAAFDASGDLLVAGSRRIGGDNTDFVVCKFHGAGVKQFGNGTLPCVTVAFDVGGTLQDTARDLLVLPDGRLALVGSAAAANGVVQAAVAMIKPDGTPDTVFGPGGKRSWIQPDLQEENLYAAAYNGALYAVGDGKKTGSNTLAAVYEHVNQDTGTLLGGNYSFLDTGTGPAFYRDITIGPLGSPIVVGSVFKNGKYRGLVTRLNTVGDYDPTWDNGNAYDALYAGDLAQFSRIVPQSDGKFLVAGTVTASGGGSSALVVARYNASGSRDVGTFNLLAGYRSVDFQVAGSYDYGAVLTLQGGRPVLAGSVQINANNFDLGVARLQNDLIYSNSFGRWPKVD